MMLTVFDVTNTNSSGVGSLAAAIQDANNNAGPDEIQFHPTLSGQTVSVGIRLDIRDDLEIVGLGADVLTLDSNNSAPVFFVASGNTVAISGLSITGGNADSWGDRGGGIRNAGNLTVIASRVFDNSAELGAGVYNEGTLVLQDSTVDSNEAGSSGGGIYNVAQATIVNSTIAENQSTTSGSGILVNTGSAVTKLTNSSIVNNHSSGNGGGIEQWSGDLQLNNTLVIGNTRSAFARRDISGSVDTANSFNNLVGDPFSAGGLIEGDNGNLLGDGADSHLPVSSVLVTPLTNNGGTTPSYAPVYSRAVDGGRNSQALDAAGNPLVTDQRGAGFGRLLDGDNNGSASVDVGAVEADIPSELVVSTIVDAIDGDFGAEELSLREAIQIANNRPGPDTITFAPALEGATLELDDFVLTLGDDTTIQGPGADLLTVDGRDRSHVFFVQAGSEATISGISITGGDADGWGDDGGGIRNQGTLEVDSIRIFGNVADNGAGIHNSGTLTVRNSTIDGNEADTTGGGVYNANAGDIRVINSTLSGNTAMFGTGIGIGAGGDSSTVLTNSTVAMNASTLDGGGIQRFGGSVVLHNTLVIGNTRANGSPQEITGAIDVVHSFSNLIGDPSSTGGLIEGIRGNMIGDGSGNTIPAGTVIDTTLASNGGSTPVHALLDSRAIDGGDNLQAVDANGDTLVTDQRGSGFGRILTGKGLGTAFVDVGAFEAPTASSFILLEDDVLYVVGSAGVDVIRVSQAGSQLQVDADFNGQVQQEFFSIADVTSIEVHALGGNDDVRLASIDTPGTLMGGDGDDELRGSHGADSILGGIGNDSILGGQSGDQIDGGEGNDTVRSGPGDDVIVDMSGDNRLQGDDGNDQITTGSGDDSLRGGPGDDVIEAGDGANDVRAGGGADTVTTGSDGDFISAGSQNDSVNSGAGPDEVRTGNGADFVDAAEGDDTVVAGRGPDTVLGSMGNDLLIGNNGDDIVLGGDGNDTLQGSADTDVLIGGIGGDDLRAGSSDDLLIGGTTVFDTDMDALRGIQREWSSQRTYEARVANLRDGSGAASRFNGDNFLTANANVSDEDAADEFVGGSARDWYFARLGSTVASDVLSGVTDDELIDELFA